ncbi:IPT/TIG domain-containing protein [Flagellimonas myxillae]|uniref:IPT/TIG domain-containing protein n=1 Tax=Flagellimonas myxillae TaxID=2942214 RepID=UPI00201EE77D|nr:IPT/TIG domain-containing protein [Muricauda myxillae]MCL6266053.1 IPT/TIG domain-containing protein [Muricauda myxillae]
MRKSSIFEVKKWNVFALPLLAMLFIVACSKKDDDDTPPEVSVSITSISPLKGEVGTEITVVGSEFSAVASENTVTLGGTAVTLNSAKANELKFDVPEGATSGKVSVKVGSSTATSTETFTVTIDPTAVVGIVPSYDYTTTKFEIGESVSIDVSVTAEEGISEFGLYKSVNGATPIAIEDDYDAPEVGDTEFSATYEFVVTELVDDIVEYIVMVKDEDDEAFATASHTIDVVAQGQGGSGGLYRLLNPKTQNLGYGTQGNEFNDCLNSGEPEAYKAKDVPDELTIAEQMGIDITIGVTNFDGDGPGTNWVKLISPDAREGLGFGDLLEANSSTTKFNSVQITSLDGITSTDVENNIGNDGNSAQIIGVGSVYSFINQAGAKGYIKVNDINGSGNNRTVFLEILVQEPQVIQ